MTDTSSAFTSPGTYSVDADGYDGSVAPIEIRSSDVVLDGRGHTIDGSNQPGTCGIRIVGGGRLLSNIVVKNIRLTNGEAGIHADGITLSVMEDSQIAHNNRGITMEDAQNVQVRNNHIIANDFSGVTVTDSGNTFVHANNIKKMGDGFTAHGGGGSEMYELYIHAVQVDSSADTEVSRNDIDNTDICISLRNSLTTRVMGNRLIRVCGIYSYDPGDGTIIANNVFNNSAYHVFGPLQSAIWNQTPSPGPNIVGGPQLGGNFWANERGTGFSETHPDRNGDGFWDEPFEND